MIKPKEMAELVADELPELGTFDSSSITARGCYAILFLLSNYIRTSIADDETLRKCFKLVASLHRNGNRSVKSAIENTFIYSLSFIDNMCDFDRKRVMELMPKSLHLLYIAQVVHYGI